MCWILIDFIVMILHFSPTFRSQILTISFINCNSLFYVHLCIFTTLRYYILTVLLLVDPLPPPSPTFSERLRGLGHPLLHHPHSSATVAGASLSERRTPPCLPSSSSYC